MKNRVGTSSVIALFGGVFLAVGYVNPSHSFISLSELVLQLSGSRGNLNLGFSMHELLSLTMRMFPDFVLEMYLGTLLYRHFCTASVYVFSRYTKRLKWYFKEVSLLGQQVFLYQIFLVIAVILVSICRYHIQVDTAGICLLIYHFVLRTVWIFCMTLLINLLSILFGSDFAFVCIMGVQAFCITLLGIADAVEKAIAVDFGIIFLKWNPMARLVLCWQSSELQMLKEILNPPYPGLEMKDSIIQYMFLCVAVVVVGAVLVKRHDLTCSNAEEGEM